MMYSRRAPWRAAPLILVVAAVSLPARANAELPDRIVGDNAISGLVPLQFGAVGYLPRARIGFQYDRRLRKGHWLYVGAAGLFDSADHRIIGQQDCWPGQDETDIAFDGTCERGAVAGADLYLGYAFKWQLQEHPYLVPMIRLGIGGAWWRYARLRSIAAREQARWQSWTINLRLGGGARFFPRKNVGVGVDLNIPIGFLVHTNRPLAGQDQTSGGFLLGFEVLIPIEYRF